MYFRETRSFKSSSKPLIVYPSHSPDLVFRNAQSYSPYGLSYAGKLDPVAILIAVALLPVGLSMFGFPLGPHHLIAPLAWSILLLTGRSQNKVVRRWATFILFSTLLALATSVLYGDVVSINPIMSMAHFSAPYFVIPAVACMNDKSVRWLWERSVDVFAIASIATLASSALLGRTTVTNANGRVYALANFFPNVAGDAQVNTWSAYLLAGSTVSIVYLFRGLSQRRIRSFVVVAAVCSSFLSVAMSGSRANTAVAIAIVVSTGVALSRGHLRVRSQHRVVVRIAILVLVVILGFFALDLAADNKRLSAKADVGVSEQFGGRSERLTAMVEDLQASPIVGTGFGDFALNQPELKKSSPHNQWIGALHKVGIPLGVAYLALVFRHFVPKCHSQSAIATSLFVLMVVGLIGCVYDVLTAVPSGVALLLVPRFFQLPTDPSWGES